MRTAIAIALLFACKGSSDAPAPAPAPAKVTAADAAPAVAAKPKPKPKEAKPSAPTPLTAEQKAARKKFWAAMSAGRKATDAKDYDTAIASFTDALKILPDNARALDERGYAEALATQYDVAEKDLRRSLGLTKVPSLVGAGWYNLGLVAEGRGDLALARVAFANSNLIHPTKAAAGKLTGKSSCTAELKAPPPGKTFKTWMDLWKDLEAHADDLPDANNLAQSQFGWLGCYESDDTQPHPKSDAEVQAALCPSDTDAPGKCDGAGPWLISYGDPSCGLAIGAVIAQADGTLLAIEGIGTGNGGRCESSDDVELEDGGPLWIHVSRDVQDMVDMYDDPKDGPTEIDDCEKDCDNLCEKYGCSEACFDNDDELDDYFYDAKTGKPLLAVAQHGGVNVTLQGSGVFLKGAGCEEAAAFK